MRSPVRLSRRHALVALGAAVESACDDDGPSPAAPAPPSSAACPPTPMETRGPFPTIGEFVRGGRAGADLELSIPVVDGGCAPVSGAEVSIWQVNADGDHSQYGGAASDSWLRGSQPTDAAGRASFLTIYPGWYRGRAAHVHVEGARGGRPPSVTQIAFPDEVSAVHRSGAYAGRGPNPTTNEGDGGFRDGVARQLATVAGDAGSGLRAEFRIAVA